MIRRIGLRATWVVSIAVLLLVVRTGEGYWAEEPRRQSQKYNSDPALVEFLKAVEREPKSPEDALRSIRVASGFRVELVASEPLVADPIAFEWGADGKLWVVEMGDYPQGLDGKGAPGGSVKILEDRDGDGRYDVSTVFLGGLGFPTGVMPWRNGVLISRAPDILYAEDVNGDGKADRVEVVFTGFVPGNPQHRVNGFDLGLDGMVYGANGDSGGSIRAAGSSKEVSIRGRDFRFDPDSKRFETESGQTQFGRHRDDWGRWFGNNNSNWGWHYVLSEAALKRNPNLALASPRQSLDPDARVFPDSRTLPRFNELNSANKVTSANSPTPYRDDLFGPDFASSLFVSEPVHNLVRRLNLTADGPTFGAKGVLADGNREFLASTDPWFRPTMLRTGPDGALWIADMYRAVIEHPEWIADDVETKINLRAGADRGHLYRVVREGVAPRRIPRLDRLDTLGLVAALDSPSGWQRDTAQRLLGHRRDPAAIEPLRALVRSSKGPKTRVQAVWTLRNLGGLDRETVRIALSDPHPQARRAAIEAGAGPALTSPEMLEALARLVDDPDAEVRFALALALGDLDDPRAGRALARLALRDGQNPWSRAAILSSARGHAGAILTGLFEGSGPEGPPSAWVEPLFALATARANPGGLGALIEAVDKPRGAEFAPWQFAAAAGLIEAADRARSPELIAATGRLTPLLDAARTLAGDERAPLDRRLVAIRVLGRSEGDRAVLAGLLTPQNPETVQEAALRALARTGDRRVADVLMGGWKGYTPALRGGVLDIVMGRPSWTASLLSSLEDKCVPPAEIPPAYRRRLLDQADRTLRGRASAIFEEAAVSTRREVLDAYRPALASPGDPKAGAAVFRKACVACHKLEGAGFAVGPDLMTLTDASPEALLVAILDPNRAFEAKYSDYSVHLKDGRVLSGVIASESANAITLLRLEGREDILLRSEIEAVSASGRSLMPEGIEKDLTPRDLADLVTYITALRAPPRGEARPK
jgi:putative membrane-bound dehydrogenase-like protein